jgi:hypothetical protein
VLERSKVFVDLRGVTRKLERPQGDAPALAAIPA